MMAPRFPLAVLFLLLLETGPAEVWAQPPAPPSATDPAAKAADEPLQNTNPAPTEDPRDEEIFGTQEESAREQEMFGSESDDDFEEAEDGDRGEYAKPSFYREAVSSSQPDDELDIGGSLYLQSSLFVPQTTQLSEITFSAPTNLDLYLDARPNDRLRGFVRSRLVWSPNGNPDTGGVSTNAALDELWFRFDAARTVFFTVGQAHIRWGATRIWNPVDVLQSTRRDPLAFFDLRTGVPQVKIHLPIESLGWNFYLLGLLEGVDSLAEASGGARAEFVFGTAELGLTGALREAEDPKAGLDISMGIGEVDWTAECGLLFDSPNPSVQIASGVDWTLSVFDDDILILGFEGFYNPGGADSIEDAVQGALGYSDADVAAAAALLEASQDSEGLSIPESTPTEFSELESAVSEALTPFYIGKWYAGGVVSLPRPGTWNDTSFTALTLANLSDNSVLSRLDISHQVLTYLSLQGYGTVFWGQQGELRPGPNALGSLSPLLETFLPSPPVSLFQFGLNLRMNL